MSYKWDDAVPVSWWPPYFTWPDMLTFHLYSGPRPRFLPFLRLKNVLLYVCICVQRFPTYPLSPHMYDLPIISRCLWSATSVSTGVHRMPPKDLHCCLFVIPPTPSPSPLPTWNRGNNEPFTSFWFINAIVFSKGPSNDFLWLSLKGGGGGDSCCLCVESWGEQRLEGRKDKAGPKPWAHFLLIPVHTEPSLSEHHDHVTGVSGGHHGYPDHLRNRHNLVVTQKKVLCILTKLKKKMLL